MLKERLVFMSCAGRAAWLCISEVTAVLQGQLNHEESYQFSQAYPTRVSRVG